MRRHYKLIAPLLICTVNIENYIREHSKLRPIYPTPELQKNYPRQDIKTGDSPRSGKVRKGQKSGCFPRSNRENGQIPNWTKLTKIDLKGSHLLALK